MFAVDDTMRRRWHARRDKIVTCETGPHRPNNAIAAMPETAAKGECPPSDREHLESTPRVAGFAEQHVTHRPPISEHAPTADLGVRGQPADKGLASGADAPQTNKPNATR
jgi:hypothetical protein